MATALVLFLDRAVDAFRAARHDWLVEHRDHVDAVRFIRTTRHEIQRARWPDREWPEPGRRYC